MQSTSLHGEKDYFNNCIGSLEHHVHNVFASVRVPGEDFVYSASVELYNKLDDYCDNMPINRQESKPPLLIKGETGTGKSALLSNWIHRRERNSTRSKIHSPLGEEFMFWHAVGCSRQSMNANSLIRRLIVDLKNRFELARDIPKSQERLSWELPRFLELAAKKGRVIIVIDGLNRLVNNDNGEDGLTWLPLQFPPNVRFILSVTTPPSVSGENPKTTLASDQNDKSALHKSKKSRILQELERRNVPCINLKSLERNLCRNVVDTFISKTVNNENAALTMGPYVSHFLPSSEQDGNAAALQSSSTDLLAGFLLFETQINGLLSHPEGGIPFFLRLFLRCMQFAVSRGYSSWFIFEQWLLAKNVSELLLIILRTFEDGFVVTRDFAQADCDRTVAAGGLPALKNHYSWHPFFLSLKSSEYSSTAEHHRPSNIRASILAANKSDNASKSRISVPMQESAHVSFPGSFNAEMATDIVEGALKTMTLSTSSPTPTDKNTSSADARKAPATSTGGGKNVSQLVLQSLTDQEMNDVSQQADLKLQLALKQSMEIIEDAMMRTREKVESDNSPTFMTEMISLMKEAQAENTRSAGRDKHRFTLREHPKKFSKPERNHLAFSVDVNESEETESGALDDLHNDNDSLNSISSIEGGSIEKGGPNSEYSKGLNKGHKFMSANAQPSPERSNNRHSFQQATYQTTDVIDPSEGVHLLPVYLRGGVTTVGFGELLGNALALLYVSRQGLREKELWKILSLLQYRAEQSKRADITASKEVRLQQLEMTRQLASQLLMSRGLLADIFRSEDTTHTGYISLSCIFNGIKKLYPDTSKADVLKLLEFIESNLKSSEEVESLRMGGRVHYEKLLKILLKLNRQLKFNETKHSRTHSQKTLKDSAVADDDDEDDDYDNFNLKLSPNTKKSLKREGSMKGDEGKHPHPKDEDGKVELDEHNYSLGSVIEESLLGILCAVGVLYSAENKLLILPSDSEPFRIVVFERYILNRGGPQYWHQQLIQYFQTESNSLRRCEELPWHLKICRKWNSLRDTLVDLKTFDLMYNNDLKDELMDYWVLLTEGPLFVHDPKPELPGYSNNGQFNGKQAAKATGPAHEDSDVDSLDNILRDIDRALELNTSLKEIRKHTLKNQIQPFDVVEELNKSVEQWVGSVKPLPSVIHKVINQISRFMAEFSKLAKSSPRFLRVGVDLHSMALFGISFDEIKADIAVNHLSLTSSGDSNEDKDVERATESNLLEPVYKEGPPQFPTDAMLSSGKKLYAYLRWVWIQFPWIALHPAGSIALNDTGGLASAAESMAFSGEIGDDGLPITATSESYQGPTTNENERLQRVWNCKKTDPTLPVFQKSASRQVAALKPRALTSLALEKSVEIALDSLYDEMVADADKAGDSLPGAALKNNRYPDEGAKTKASADESTDFSVTETLHRSKKNQGKVKTPKFDIDAALAGMNNGPHNTFLTEVDEEIKHMSADEFIHQQEIQQLQLQEQKVQMKRNSKEAQTLAYNHMLERIAKMKSIWNKLDIIHRDKARTLAHYEHQVSMRDESDAQLLSDVNNGEALIKALGERNIAIERSLNDAKTINEGYMQLMKAVKNNAPFRESHVKSLEIELELAERQFKDLCHHRSNLYKDTDKMETIRKKEITDRISYFAHARSEIALKKVQVEDEVVHLERELKNKKHFSSVNAGGMPPKALDDSQRRRKSRRRGDDNLSMASGSTKSSKSSQQLNITKQMAAFVNVLAKKKLYNAPLIKEGDTLQSLRMVDKFNPPVSVAEPSSSMVMVDVSQSQEVQSVAAFGSLFLKGAESAANNKLRFAGGKSEADNARPLTVIDSQPNSRMQMRGQVQKLIKYLLDTTESSSVDNFLDRFHQNKKLVDILNNQQMLLDSRLSQLRTEHQELSTLHNDMSFVGEEELSSELSVQEVEKGSPLHAAEEYPSTSKKPKQSDSRNQSHTNSNSSNASTLDDQSSVVSLNQSALEEDNDDRYIDSKLFSKEVRLRQMQLLNKNSVYIINEVRTAVAHVMNIIMLNEKLLSTLPKVAPPTLNDDSDIAVCLSWCEEKLIAVNEALSMESNKSSGANASDEVKTLSQRQNELATLIMKSAAKDLKNKQFARSKSADRRQNKKQQGGLSKNVINSSYSNLPLPSAIMVTSASKIDTVYDGKMTKLCTERDKRQDLIESKRMYAEGSENNNDLQKFLAGGIDIKTTKELTRKAGQLVNKRRGRQVNYGLVLQDLIVSKGQTVSLIEKSKTLTSPGLVKKAKNGPPSSSNWNAAAPTTSTETNAVTTDMAAN